MERDENDAKIIFADNALVEFESIRLGPRERGEIVLAPKVPMVHPVLFMSQVGSRVLVEEIIHKRTSLERKEQWSIEGFRFGRRLDLTVTKDEYLTIIIYNDGEDLTSVGASLVCSKE